MLFTKRKQPQLTRAAALDATPVAATASKIEPLNVDDEAAGAKVTVAVQAGGVGRMLLRLPRTVTRTYELDAIGLFVWQNCDGRTTVRQLIRKVGQRCNVSLREAEVATVQFVQTLATKGLIGIAVDKLKER